MSLSEPSNRTPSARPPGQRQEAGAAGNERARRGGVQPGGAGDFRRPASTRAPGLDRVGDGVAIPHGKLAKCERIFGVFARLERAIDFEAPDGLPVDLIFMLVAPESAGADHLKALATIARLLRNGATAAQLRATRDPAALYALITMAPTSNAA